jgi:hypothetical protein
LKKERNKILKHLAKHGLVWVFHFPLGNKVLWKMEQSNENENKRKENLNHNGRTNNGGKV